MNKFAKTLIVIGLGMTGNFAWTQYYSDYVPEEAVKHLSPTCNRIYEGIRTRYQMARYKRDSTLETLLREFDDKCSDELQEAREKIADARVQKRDHRRAEQREKREESSASDLEKKKKMIQCNEMKSAISSRKARPSLTEGDKADIAIFEQRFQERCSEK